MMSHELPRHRRRPLRLSHLAAGLVLALAADLTLMASPLHAMAMSPEAGAAMELAGAMSAPPSLSCMGSAGNCAAEWTAPTSSWSIQSVLSGLPAFGAQPLLGVLGSRRPSPQAHGLPEPPDLQVLLQVFRI
jgi:hypothetical protein